MNIANVERGERGFTITFSDQSDTEFPFIWLRDNDPGDFHPDTHERVFDLTTVDLDIEPEDFESANGMLSIQWPDKNDSSSYPVDWLFRHRPGRRGRRRRARHSRRRRPRGRGPRGGHRGQASSAPQTSPPPPRGVHRARRLRRIADPQAC